jgi:hypothetical protein
VISRTFDMGAVNAIANDPAVSCSFGHKGGPMDFSALAAEPGNYIVLTDGASIAGIAEWTAPDVWQVHTMALPAARGTYGFDAFREMLRQMFTDHGAFAIWGQTPIRNRAARAMNRRMGAESRGFVERETDGRCELFWLSRARFLAG